MSIEGNWNRKVSRRRLLTGGAGAADLIGTTSLPKRNPRWHRRWPSSGATNATTFGPNKLDGTFGPQVMYQRAADRPNQPPSDGLQFFGHAVIAGDTEVMTVKLKDLAGTTLYSVDLEPVVG